MNISGYGVSYNYGSYGYSPNKAKSSSTSTANPAEKPKTESKNSNANDSYYNLFNDKAKTKPSGTDTKTELTRDEELLIAMAELGRKHAQQGIPWQEVDEEFFALAKE